jgi:hypothetical protein
MEQLKTIEEWFDTIPEPARTYAYKYAKESYGEAYVRIIKMHRESLRDSISCAFTWDNTPQGDLYWYKVATGLI